jgi:peptide subunit release factor 1 (eRF1)
MTTGEHDLRARALALMAQANLEREEKLVKTMITSAAKGGNAVTGLDATLRTVSEGRVQTLIVSDGYRSPGYHHQNSNLLAARQGDTAAIGDDEPEKVMDVVEAAVYRTMEQGGKVEIVSDNSQLEDAGRIGAILRY